MLNADTIFGILTKIAELTRTKQGNTGPLSVSEINRAFEKVVGVPPVDESAMMLQRLPALGRVSSESTDRRFIDYYILDGLRAENLTQLINEGETNPLQDVWVNPLQDLGIEIISNRIKQTDGGATYYLEYLKQAIDSGNKVMAGDVLAGLIAYDTASNIDLQGIVLSDSTIYSINLAQSLIDNFEINESIIFNLDITSHRCSKIKIKGCIISNLYGASDPNELPAFIKENEIENYYSGARSSQSRIGGLSAPQMVFVSIIKKTYTQSSGGRNEDDLLSSAGGKIKRELTKNILQILTKAKILGKSEESGTTIYKAKGYEKKRIEKILNELENSKDPIWKEISKV